MGIKGNNGVNNNSNNGRGRSYGVMLVLAFGGALLGALIIHKLRETRVFNLILKQKDQDIISLRILFQKERDYGQELRRRYDEMKAKIYTIRNQKTELDRRLSETQSTVNSLKDELRALDVAFQEKRNQIKTLEAERDRMSREKEKESPRITAMIESLRQKEAEIVELRRRLEYTEKFLRSVKSDDPSRSNVTAVNVTVASQNEADPKKIVTVAADGKVERHKSRRGKGDKDHGNTKGGMKLEIRGDGENGVSPTAKGHRGIVSNGKEKKRKSMTKNKKLEGKVYNESRGKNRAKRVAFESEVPLESNRQRRRPKL